MFYPLFFSWTYWSGQEGYHSSVIFFFLYWIPLGCEKPDSPRRCNFIPPNQKNIHIYIQPRSSWKINEKIRCQSKCRFTSARSTTGDSPAPRPAAGGSRAGAVLWLRGNPPHLCTGSGSGAPAQRLLRFRVLAPAAGLEQREWFTFPWTSSRCCQHPQPRQENVILSFERNLYSLQQASGNIILSTLKCSIIWKRELSMDT